MTSDIRHAQDASHCWSWKDRTPVAGPILTIPMIGENSTTNVNERHAGHCRKPPYGSERMSHSVCIYSSQYADLVLGASSALADYVEGMADLDIACPDQAEALMVKVVPSTAPHLVIQYRTTFTLTRQFGSRDFRKSDRRHFVTKFQTGVAMVQPRGPLGAIFVKLKPEAATSLLGERMQYFLDAEVGLDALFGASQVSLLEERLAEAKTSAERFACVERFLAANLRAHRVKPLACQAAALLRQNPHLRIRHLADQLGVSERHLSRSFQAMFGMGPKHFARIARIENVCFARGQGASWADVAYGSGFSDQAHMINDFTEIVGVPPAQLI
jgi:AraC-like DNA-binding protein